MIQNCSTCTRRKKHQGMDDGGGDFWECLALPVLPAFVGYSVRRFDPPLVNLNSFKPEHPCHDYQQAKACPLWEGPR
jgi:hypothetical protein